MFGVTSDSGDPTGGLYGAGRFGYSINNVTTSNLSAVATTASITDAADVNYDSDYSASLSSYKKVTIALPTDADLYAVRSFTFLSGSTEVVPVQAFSKIASTYTASFVLPTADADKIFAAKSASFLFLSET